MPTLLKIGLNEFLVRKPETAAKIISLLSDAVPVDTRHRTFNGKNIECVYPTDSAYRGELSMRTVPAANIFKLDPGDDAIPEPTPKQLTCPR